MEFVRPARRTFQRIWRLAVFVAGSALSLGKGLQGPCVRCVVLNSGSTSALGAINASLVCLLARRRLDVMSVQNLKNRAANVGRLVAS